MMLRLKTHLFSLRNKILFVVALTTTLTAISISSLYYFKTKQQAIENELLNMTTITSLISPLLLSEFQDLQDDILALRQVTPIIDMHETIHSDKDEKRKWTESLQTIFKSVIVQKKNYVQIRYIGVDQNGLEIVRVDRKGDSIVVTPEEDLQEKGQETYFQEAMKLADGKVYMSSINLNREHGKVQIPYLPVIRVIVPVYGRNNKINGILVINAAYKKILTNLLSNLKIGRDLFVINKNGDYLLYHEETEKWEFYVNTTAKAPHGGNLVELILSENKDSGTINVSIDGRQNISHYKKVYYDPEKNERFLAIALAVPEDIFLEAALKIKKAAISLGFVMIVISCLFAATLSVIITNPIGKIIQGTRKYAAGSEEVSLPTKSKDEIGELARAFEQMMHTLNESRKAEKDLLVRMQVIMDNTVDGLITINEEGGIESFNKACTDIFDYTADEVMGKNIKILMPAPYHNEHDTYLKNYKNTGQKKIIGIGREVSGQKKDGTVFPIDLSISEVNVHGRKIYSGIVRDITERKKAEDALLVANAELEEFAYRTSHDLKSPLLSSIALLEVTKKSIISNEKDNALQSVKLIKNSLGKLQDLVEDILALTRAKKVIIAPERVDAHKLIEDTLEQLSYMDNFNRLEIEKNLNFDGTLITKNDRLHHIVQNLISNALKYQDLEKDKSFLKISTNEKNQKFILTLEDNGIGIPPAKREHMFEMFQRFHPRKSFGSGLGLYMVKKSADLLGGEILYQDTGQGSVFTLIIPLKHNDA